MGVANVVNDQVGLVDVDPFHDAEHEVVQHDVGAAPGAPASRQPGPLQFERSVIETVRVDRPGVSSVPRAPRPLQPSVPVWVPDPMGMIQGNELPTPPR